MKRLLQLLPLFVSMAILASSCGKNDEPNPSPTPGGKEDVKTIKIDASDYASFKYFSFEKGKVVEPTNFAESIDWDLAFHRYDFRTNGGKSGKGKGAAAETESTNISDKIAIPAESKFQTDELAKIIVKFNVGAGEHSIKYEEQPLNNIITSVFIPKMENGKPVMGPHGPIMILKHKGAIVQDMSGPPPPKVEITGKVFVVRCANGKYAKIKITDYRDEKAKTGHITMQYVYPIN